MSRRVAGSLAAAAALVLSACTTTAVKQQAHVRAGADVAVSPASPDAVATPGVEATAPGAATPGAAGVTGGPVAARRGSGAATGPASASTGSGPVKIGFWVVDATAACRALGANANCQNDSPYITAAVNYVNAHGGVGGHKIEASIFVSDALAAGSWAVQSSAACADLIEDHKVQFVMAPWVGGRNLFTHCAAAHGVPVVDTGFWPYDATEYQSLAGYLYLVSRPSPNRWVAAYIEGLVAQDYFTPGKVGLVRFDAAPFTRVTNQVLKAHLAAHGLTLTDDIAVATPQSASDLGAMSSQLNNAILKLRNDGITHVLVLDLGSELSFFLLPQAESQGYRPRYGLSTYQNMNLLMSNVPHVQFHNSRGVGWSPILDVPLTADPGSAMATNCKHIYNAVGLKSDTGRSLYCDVVYFFKDALERAPEISPAGLRAGAAALGSNFQASYSLGTVFDGSRYDGPSMTRDFAFDEGCDCFKYGTARPM